MRVGYDATNYPLSWPAATPRTRSRKRSAFARGRTVFQALEVLDGELRRLNARQITVSTNLQTRVTDGRPRSGQGEPRDPGVAIYFMLKGEPRVFACDKWDRVADNLYAIAKTIESLRGIDRWGVGETQQAFRGYAALPETAGGRPWWDVLGLTGPTKDEATIQRAFKIRAKECHPDHGGDPGDWAALCDAKDQALGQARAS